MPDLNTSALNLNKESNVSYNVIMTDNESGETKSCRLDLPWEDGSAYWWREGNYSCDCNRVSVFYPNLDEEPDECTESKFTVHFAVLDSGECIKID